MIEGPEGARHAASQSAAILMMDGQLGCIAPEADAGMLLSDGDPPEVRSLLSADGWRLAAIMKGAFVKRPQASPRP
jgi:hypothetical protein